MFSTGTPCCMDTGKRDRLAAADLDLDILDELPLPESSIGEGD